MRAMKNLTALTAISIIFAVILINGKIDAAPYQELIQRKGFIPVYIRYGETPLSEIHPKLAEAFNENAHIVSEDLKKVDGKTETEHSMKKRAEEPEISSKKTISDIASFDVIKVNEHEVEH